MDREMMAQQTDMFRLGLMKVCKICGGIKPRDSFYGTRWKQSYCKPCQIKFAKQWVKDNREHYLKKKKENDAKIPKDKKNDRRLRERYGITLEEYRAMHIAQNGACAICLLPCSTKKNLGVDHCHSSGMVRGLLCDRCNTLLGRVKDNVDILERAIAYLSIWTAK